MYLLNKMTRYLVALLSNITIETKIGYFRGRNIAKEELAFIYYIGYIVSELTFQSSRSALAGELDERLKFCRNLYTGELQLSKREYEELINVLKAYHYFSNDFYRNIMKCPKLMAFIANYKEEDRRPFNLREIHYEQQRMRTQLYNQQSYDIQEIRWLNYRLFDARFARNKGKYLQTHWF